MSDEGLNYDTLIEEALRHVMRTTLARVAENGLPGGHYFYITFRTHDPGVSIPDYLRAAHNSEMTIALQHQFWDLTVEEETFQVTLNFNKVPETLQIPFASITVFADPPAKFNLQFGSKGFIQESTKELTQEPTKKPHTTSKNMPKNAHKSADTLTFNPVTLDSAPPKTAAASDHRQDTDAAEVISLDAFRKPKESA